MEQWSRRRDLERQLHDGPALRIAAVTLRLGLLAQRARDVHPDIADLQAQLHLALQELRAIADRIYPPLLREAGIGPAVRELAGNIGVPVRVDAVDARFDPAAEGVAYFAVLEVLENVRSTTRTVDIAVRRAAGGLTLDLAGAESAREVAVHHRIRRLGGAVRVVGGTIKVSIPCE